MKPVSSLVLLTLLAACEGDGKSTDTDGTDGTVDTDVDAVDTDEPAPELDDLLVGGWTITSFLAPDGLVGSDTQTLRFDPGHIVRPLDENALGFRAANPSSFIASEDQLLVVLGYEDALYEVAIDGDTLTLSNATQEIVAQRDDAAPTTEEWVPAAVVGGRHVIADAEATDLAFDGTYLWYGNGYDLDVLTRYDFENDAVVSTLPTDRSAWGLAWDGEALWTSNDGYDRVHQLDMETGDVVVTSPAMGPWIPGIAWDGDAIWAYSGNEETLYHWTPGQPDLTSVLAFEESWPGGAGGLEWADGSLWIVGGAYVYRCNTSPFEVTNTWRVDGAYLTGIASDGTDFYVMTSDASDVTSIVKLTLE